MSDKNGKWRNQRIANSRHVANIREIIKGIGEGDNSEDHTESAQSLVTQLKSKQRKAIVESALASHLQDEGLKPYQAELIKMQNHLERTD